MVIAIEAVYENGVLRPKQKIPLKYKAEVRLTIETIETAPADDDPTGWKAIDSLIGCIHSGASDISENHAAYLYNDPTT